jgi:hypothetical protein
LADKKLSLALLFLVLSFSLIVGFSFAQTSAGVSAGDQFVYDCVLNGSHDKNDYWWVWVPEWNQSKWKITITNVLNSHVTFDLQIQLSNGTIQTFPSQYVDLSSGGSNEQNYMFFVFPNLNSSDPLYLSDNKYIINSTIYRTFASEQREINHINFSSTVAYWDVYLDKKTGALVELSESYLDLAGTFSLKLAETSLWVVSTQQSIQPTTSSTITSFIQPSTTPTPTSTNTAPSPTIPELSVTFLIIMILILSVI